jgi:hypothetical protein
MIRRRVLAFSLMTVFFAGCSGTRVQAPSPGPASAPVLAPIGSLEAGHASFFFPVAVPLAEVRRIAEANLPPRMSDERKQEISSALQDDFYRYALERGPVEVGFSAGRLVFSFPVHGSLTLGGRLAGLPVQQTVEFSGRVRGTALPSITPDWRPDPQPAAQVELDRADLKVLSVFSVSVRSFLEQQLNPILNRELRRAAGGLLADLALRRKAEAAWRSLHVARRAVEGENLWIRFQPLEISLARITEKDGVLHTGLGIAGEISLALGRPLAAPAVLLLPPLRVDGMDGERTGGFEMEVPVAASPEELSRWADRALRGLRFHAGRDREMEITSAGLGVDGDRMILTLDFRTGGREGRLSLRGHPVLDPGTRVLRLADLQYDLASGNLFLKLADRLHRAELLERLQKSAHLDLAPLFGRAERQTAQAVQGLFPSGSHGEVRVEPVRVLGLGVAGGVVWVRCRVAGSISALGPAFSASSRPWRPSRALDRQPSEAPPAGLSATSLRGAPAGSGRTPAEPG